MEGEYPYIGNLLTMVIMVINHLLAGMILQVYQLKGFRIALEVLHLAHGGGCEVVSHINVTRNRRFKHPKPVIFMAKPPFNNENMNI